MKQKIKCAVCGVEFEKDLSLKELNDNKYGFACKQHRWEHIAIINHKISYKPESHIKRYCDNCGKEFIAKKSHDDANNRRNHSKVRFCCQKCMYEYRKSHRPEFYKSDRGREILSEKMRGSKNPLYKNGNRIAFAKYDYKFRPLLRKQIREKFDNNCCLCGRHKQDDEKNFACHHKDFDKKNNDIDNFELLCPRCHQIKHEEYKKLLKL